MHNNPAQAGNGAMRADVEYNTTGVIDGAATTGGSSDGWGTYFICDWQNNTGQDVTWEDAMASKFQFCLASRRCLCASPSIQYSILRKTISIKIVCGQVQPHQRRPRDTVNTTVITIPVSVNMAKIKVSCGQNICQKRINFLLITSNRKSGSSLYFINGVKKKKASKIQEMISL